MHKMNIKTGSNKDKSEIPSSETPALANANNGIIAKATYGLIACSTLINKEKSLSFFLWGMVIANKTPAMVAWMPELWVKSHKKTPTIR